MNRFVTRLSAVTASLGAAVVLAGCGTGQISQTANQEPAVNGTGGLLKALSLRNVQIQAEQDGESIPAGHTANLVFVISNQSPDTADELTGVTTDIGKVTVRLPGPATLPPGGLVSAVAPDQLDKTLALRDVEKATVTTASLALSQPIRNGLTYPVTFHFKESGEVALSVPIAAPPKARPDLSAQH